MEIHTRVGGPLAPWKCSFAQIAVPIREIFAVGSSFCELELFEIENRPSLECPAPQAEFDSCKLIFVEMPAIGWRESLGSMPRMWQCANKKKLEGKRLNFFFSLWESIRPNTHV